MTVVSVSCSSALSPGTDETVSKCWERYISYSALCSRGLKDQDSCRRPKIAIVLKGLITLEPLIPSTCFKDLCKSGVSRALSSLRGSWVKAITPSSRSADLICRGKPRRFLPSVPMADGCGIYFFAVEVQLMRYWTHLHGQFRISPKYIFLNKETKLS